MAEHTADNREVSGSNPLGPISNTTLKTLYIHNISAAYTMVSGSEVIPRAAVLVKGENIAEIGPEQEVQKHVPSETQSIDAGGRCVLPGLIDPHTHLIYAGERSKEFALRLKGADYLEILKAGGGILSTVEATRKASLQELVDHGRARLERMLSWGVTTVEVKSGYGLNTETEIKILEAAQSLRQEGWQLISTFLGAHAIPPEFKDNRGSYIDLLINEMMPKARPLAEFCDVFMDKGVFTQKETERIFEAAQKLGYKLKIHADELASTGGAEMAGKWGAVSADHLLHPSDNGLKLMALAGTVAVMLPGTSFALRKTYAPVKKFARHGLKIAVATDHNPGTSPILSLPMAATIGVLSGGLSIDQALAGMTVNAAAAIGLNDRGRLARGLKADILIIDGPDPTHMFYRIGENLTWKVIRSGQVVWRR